MAIKKIYEVICDFCGNGCIHGYSVKDAKIRHIESNGIIRNKKHYCDEKCYKAEMVRNR